MLVPVGGGGGGFIATEIDNVFRFKKRWEHDLLMVFIRKTKKLFHKILKWSYITIYDVFSILYNALYNFVRCVPSWHNITVSTY